MYTYICCKCKSTLNTSSYRLSIKSGNVCTDCKVQAKHKKSYKGKYVNSKGRTIYRKLPDEYYQSVWELTEQQPLNTLPDYSKRGWEEYHLDHIVPISYGRDNNIPPELIASIENLRFIPSQDNMSKRDILTEESIKLIQKWSKQLKSKA